ncbi:putative bifunctional methylenetetrahydrofolate dehydrogenase/cyclohydrolase [Plasmodium gaboni]|uniref:Putative bifunctional methylenetetrahydrofolate dehydrogenase/cyclohydrolase n=1 Tax=Plasmodium gaboni TaxID=647221 RepID=A0A151LS46_9APIC|nr:putative bifunctional methylenetetrahydrofolate dehydrogenase/cyclohydrolase [Plasmodium gaboni]KYO02004.1 putative bifunctional methylenetetrahydrofolate dehydrogenase/cyclohydrolase [Plasmodium gaboni]
MNGVILNGQYVSEKIDEFVLEKIKYENDKSVNSIRCKKKKKLFIIYSKNIVSYSYLYIILKKSIYLNSDVVIVLIRVNKNVSEEKLTKIIKKININENNDTSLIILSPLSYHINKCYISEFIQKEKDIDCSNYKRILKLINIIDENSFWKGKTNNKINNDKNMNYKYICSYDNCRLLLPSLFPFWKIIQNFYMAYFDLFLKWCMHVENGKMIADKKRNVFQIFCCNNLINNNEDMIIPYKKENVNKFYNMSFLCYNEKKIYIHIKNDNRKEDLYNIIIYSHLKFNKVCDNNQNDVLIFNYLENVNYNLPCCIHSILLFIKYYNIEIKNKNVLILNNNINIFLTLFIFFMRNNISTVVYDPLNGQVLCRYEKKKNSDDNKKIYLNINGNEILITNEDDFKRKCKIFINHFVYNYKKYGHNKNKEILKNMENEIIKSSDIIIIGIGRHHILSKRHIKENVIILDLGINLIPSPPKNKTNTKKKEQKKKKHFAYNMKNDESVYNYDAKIDKENIIGEQYQLNNVYFEKSKNVIQNNYYLPLQKFNKKIGEYNKVYNFRRNHKRRHANLLYKLKRYYYFLNRSYGYKYINDNKLKRRMRISNKKILNDNKSKLKYINCLANILKNYVIMGDVDMSCKSKCSYISSVPGGLGPITTSMLFYNLYFKN